jgi:hypothetical protein
MTLCSQWAPSGKFAIDEGGDAEGDAAEQMGFVGRVSHRRN